MLLTYNIKPAIIAAMNDIKRLAWLKNELLTADYLDIANATYFEGSVAFGDLEAIGAGAIRRKYDRNGDLEYYGFQYGTYLGDERITATLKFSGHILIPGTTYSSEY